MPALLYYLVVCHLKSILDQIVRNAEYTYRRYATQELVLKMARCRVQEKYVFHVLMHLNMRIGGAIRVINTLNGELLAGFSIFTKVE